MKYLLLKWVNHMKNKLMFLTRISLEKKIKSKWFVTTNILLLVLIIGLANIDSIIKFFGGDFSETTEILVIDNSNISYDKLNRSYLEYQKLVDNINTTQMKKYSGSKEKAIEEVKKNDSILIEINNDKDNFINATITSDGGIDAIILQFLTTSLNNIKSNIAMNYYNIDDNTLALINSPIEIERIKLDENKSNDEMMEMVMSVVFPIVLLPFFMLTMFLVQMIGAEINEEKTTKGMEIIISNVPAKVHFASKLISSNVFVIMQAIILGIDGLIALIIRMLSGSGSLGNIASSLNIEEITDTITKSGVLDSMGTVIPITLGLMLLTFIAYSLLAGVLASMTTNLEDFQQLQSPIMIISLAGFYLSMMAAMFDGALFINLISYVPFISAMLTPALLLLGQIGIIDVVISFALLFGVIFLLYKYGMRIYKVGILNYSSNGLWKKMFKAMKNG